MTHCTRVSTLTLPERCGSAFHARKQSTWSTQTAADCTLPDQHDAHVNAAPRSLQRRPMGIATAMRIPKAPDW